MFTLLSAQTTQPPVEMLIGLGFLGFIAIIIFLATQKSSKAKKQAKQARITLMNEKQAVAFGSFKHTAGLPVAEDVFCNLYYCADKIEIQVSGAQFNLDFEKITDISLKTSVDIQKQLVSSAAGAVGGAMLFGAVGALIGGRVKEKQIRDVRTYLIFSYYKENTVDYIAFDVSTSIPQAGKFIDEFKKRPQKTQTINL